MDMEAQERVLCAIWLQLNSASIQFAAARIVFIIIVVRLLLQLLLLLVLLFLVARAVAHCSTIIFYNNLLQPAPSLFLIALRVHGSLGCSTFCPFLFVGCIMTAGLSLATQRQSQKSNSFFGYYFICLPLKLVQKRNSIQNAHPKKKNKIKQ